MKKPSFALYAAGYAACLFASFTGIIAGIEFDLPALLVLAGEAAVWSSMIFDNYHKRLRAYTDHEYEQRKFERFMAACCAPGTAPDQEVQQDEL